MSFQIEKALSNNFMNSNVFVNDVVLSITSSNQQIHLCGISNSTAPSALCLTGSNMNVTGLITATDASFCNLSLSNCTVTGAVRSSAAPVMIRRASGSQSHANNAMVNLLYNTDDVGNNSGNVGLTYNAGKFTNTTGGIAVYSLHYNSTFSSNTNQQRSIICQVNGNTTTARMGWQNRFGGSTPSETVGISGCVLLSLSNNEYFYIATWENSGLTLYDNVPDTDTGLSAGYAGKIEIYRLM